MTYSDKMTNCLKGQTTPTYGCKCSAVSPHHVIAATISLNNTCYKQYIHITTTHILI